MKKTILNGVIFGLTTFFTLFGSLYVYSAWTNLQTQNPGDKITSTIWNNIINQLNTLGNTVDNLNTQVSSLSSLPSGAVISFYLSSCPTGWSEANGTDSSLDLRGSFIRGMGGSDNGLDVSRTLGSYQSDSIQGHHHYITGQSGGNDNVVAFQDTNTDGVYNASVSGTSRGDVYFYVGNPKTDGVNGVVRTSNETRPKNIALLYCVKD